VNTALKSLKPISWCPHM